MYSSNPKVDAHVHVVRVRDVRTRSATRKIKPLISFREDPEGSESRATDLRPTSSATSMAEGGRGTRQILLQI